MDSFFSQLLKTITNYCDGQFSIHRLNRLNRLRWAIFYSQIEQIKQIAMDYLCSRNNRSNVVR